MQLPSTKLPSVFKKSQISPHVLHLKTKQQKYNKYFIRVERRKSSNLDTERNPNSRHHRSRNSTAPYNKFRRQSGSLFYLPAPLIVSRFEYHREEKDHGGSRGVAGNFLDRVVSREGNFANLSGTETYRDELSFLQRTIVRRNNIYVDVWKRAVAI